MTLNKGFTLRCHSCGTKNRIPDDRVGQTAKCGKCGSPVETTSLLISRPVIIGDRDFNQQVLGAQLPVLIDCWAPWCGPCKMIGPIMDELADQWKGKIRICKLNVDENPQTSAKFQIRSIPTLMIFDNGKLKDTLVGALPKQQIISAMAPYL